jgi:hypothetical protein
LQPYPVFFDYDKPSRIESCGESWQVEVQNLQLLSRMIWRPPKKDDGGLCFPAQSQNAGKVGIRGDKHAVLGSSTVKDHIIRCRLQAVIANVNGVMTGLLQSLYD